MPLVHHELCFGCGRTNLFGLLLELERTDEGAVAGRCFIKQDHQGPEPGFAHEGIIATALSEAMALACGQHARPRTIEVVLEGTVQVGTFLGIEAGVDGAVDGEMRTTASATAEHQVIARASGTYTADVHR